MVLSDDNALLITPSVLTRNLREEDLVKVDFASGKVLEKVSPPVNLGLILPSTAPTRKQKLWCTRTHPHLWAVHRRI